MKAAKSLLIQINLKEAIPTTDVHESTLNVQTLTCARYIRSITYTRAVMRKDCVTPQTNCIFNYMYIIA